MNGNNSKENAKTIVKIPDTKVPKKITKIKTKSFSL